MSTGLTTQAAQRLQVADNDAAGRPGADDLVRLPSTLSADEADEVDRVRRMFQFTLDEVLLGALARTIAQTVGDGVVAVDLVGDGRSVLKPDVDPRRTVGGFATLYPVRAQTASSREHADAIQVLDDVHGDAAVGPASRYRARAAAVSPRADVPGCWVRSPRPTSSCPTRA